MRDENGMTLRRRKFCEEFVACGNAAQAAERAGFSARSARQIGERLTKDDKCKKYISELQEQLATERIMSAAQIKAFWSDTIQDTAQKMTDRLQASNLFARAAGMYLDRVSADITTDDRRTLICLPAVRDPDGGWIDPPRRSENLWIYDPETEDPNDLVE